MLRPLRAFVLALTCPVFAHTAIAIAITLSTTADSHAASRTQASPFPSGPLVFRTSKAEFRPDGTFTVESSMEGLGTLRFGGPWKVQQPGGVELAGYAPAESGS
jgi:hypothetical protein